MNQRATRREKIAKLWSTTTLTAEEIAERVCLSGGRAVRYHVTILRRAGDPRITPRKRGRKVNPS